LMTAIVRLTLMRASLPRSGRAAGQFD
jgi:hypothetical protein